MSDWLPKPKGDDTVSRQQARQKEKQPRHSAWRKRLLLGKSAGNALANSLIALSYSPEWDEVLYFDESKLAVVAKRLPPGFPAMRKAPFIWKDEDDTRTAAWMQQNGISASVTTAGQAVQAIASEHPFHPIRDYLNSLTWDGDRRIDNWLVNHLGARPSEYVSAVGSRWLISAIARAFRPGVKTDCCLILEGKQGTLKSSAIRALGDPWFSDDLPTLGSKDSKLQLRGVWIFELAELESMSRAEVGRVKAFMSQCSDYYRPPYARRPIDVPRECIFCGSVNDSTYLRDPTGGRRFWPVACGAIDLDALKRDRDQLWAEANVRFKEGAPWWLNNKTLVDAASEEQADRYEGGVWDDLIAQFIHTRESASIEEILKECVHKDPDKWTQADRNSVGSALRSQGWQRYRVGTGKPRVYRWRPAEDTSKSLSDA